jgi:hypothetical protein
MSYSLKTPVATFKRCTDKKAVNRPLTEVLDEIRDGTHRQAVEAVRAASPDQRGELKKALPAFAVSGSSRAGRSAADLLNHSGLLQVDIDKIGVFKAFGLKDKLAADPHVFAAFISPSGDGIKLLVRIPADASRHRASFHAAESYFKERYQLTIDASCKDVMRLCFFSHDEELVLNPGAVELEVAETFQQGAKSAATAETENKSKSSSGAKVADEKDSGDVFGGPSSSYSSESLNPESCLLYNTYGQKEKYEDWPELHWHYKKHVLAGAYSSPQKGQRNAAVVGIVSQLFFMVKPSFVVMLLDQFYADKAEVFGDYPKSDFNQQVKSMLIRSLRDYGTRQALTAEEHQIYSQLTTDYQTAFRICRSLAHLDDETMPPPLFHLSCHQLAIRLGRFDIEASRMLKALVKRGVLKVEQAGEAWPKGKAWAKGEKGKATVYRWLL